MGVFCFVLPWYVLKVLMAWCYVGFIWLFEAITCLFYFIWVKTKRKITKYWLEIIQSLKRELPASAHSFIEGSSLPSFICCHSAPLPPSFKVPSRSSIGSCCLSYLRGVVTPKFDVVSSFVSQSTFCLRRRRRCFYGNLETREQKSAARRPCVERSDGLYCSRSPQLWTDDMIEHSTTKDIH